MYFSAQHRFLFILVCNILAVVLLLLAAALWMIRPYELQPAYFMARLDWYDVLSGLWLVGVLVLLVFALFRRNAGRWA
jgi:ABC-type transport system involved in multi-copper enzyme maturation permease subunit